MNYVLYALVVVLVDSTNAVIIPTVSLQACEQMRAQLIEQGAVATYPPPVNWQGWKPPLRRKQEVEYRAWCVSS